MSSQNDDWYKHRPYPHFDWPIHRSEAEQIVTDRQRVARHDFYPLIKRLDQTPEYDPLARQAKKGETGDVRYKSRRICYAAHLDSHIYSYYSDLLSEKYEQDIGAMDFGSSVVAYRQFDEPKCNIHFARDVFGHIYETCEPDEPLVALVFDIKGFFDHLNHGLLKKAWGKILKQSRLPEDHYHLYRSLTKYAYVKLSRLRELFPDFYGQSRGERANQQICPPPKFRSKVRGGGHLIVNPHEYGIPQGTPISALLSNIYMRPFDKAVHDRVSGEMGIYRRYSDDLIVVVPASRKDEVEDFVMDEITNRKLSIQEKKTEKYLFRHVGNRIKSWRLESGADPSVIEENQLQYLGFVFDGENIRIRPSSLTQYYRRMNGAIKAEANRALEDPIDEDEPVIRRSSLYERFSHKGNRNFVQYAYRAAEVMKEVAGRDAIRPQVANHWEVLHDRIDDWETWAKKKLEADEDDVASS